MSSTAALTTGASGSLSAPATPSVSPHNSPNLSDRVHGAARARLPSYTPPAAATSLSIKVGAGMGTPPLTPSPAMKPPSPLVFPGSAPTRSVSMGSLSAARTSPAPAGSSPTTGAPVRAVSAGALSAPAGAPPAPPSSGSPVRSDAPSSPAKHSFTKEKLLEMGYGR